MAERPLLPRLDRLDARSRRVTLGHGHGAVRAGANDVLLLHVVLPQHSMKFRAKPLGRKRGVADSLFDLPQQVPVLLAHHRGGFCPLVEAGKSGQIATGGVPDRPGHDEKRGRPDQRPEILDFNGG